MGPARARPRAPPSSLLKRSLAELRRALQHAPETPVTPGPHVRRPLSGWVSTTEGVTTVELVGPLDERADLEELAGRIVGPAVRLKLGGISRVNSLGYIAWRNWLVTLLAAGYDVTFHECSTTMVRQANLDPSFLPAERIVSFHAPFYCTACDFSRPILFRADQAVPIGPAECEACGGSMDLDDVESTYLLFLHGHPVAGSRLAALAGSASE